MQIGEAMAKAAPDWEKFLKFRCTGCGNCCRRTVVMVTDLDIDRIMDFEGWRLEDFIRFVNEDEAKIEKRSAWWIRFTHAGRSSRSVMALQHRPGGACVFLDDDERCTIYENRPVTCREHPFEVKLGDTLAVEHIAISDIVPCPHDWDGHVTKRELRDVVRWNERQSEAFLDKIQSWNRRRQGPKTRPAFLRSLGYDVRGRERHPPGPAAK
jgi:Fe-S-cluster containining protein